MNCKTHKCHLSAKVSTGNMDVSSLPLYWCSQHKYPRSTKQSKEFKYEYIEQGVITAGWLNTQYLCFLARHNNYSFNKICVEMKCWPFDQFWYWAVLFIWNVCRQHWTEKLAILLTVLLHNLRFIVTLILCCIVTSGLLFMCMCVYKGFQIFILKLHKQEIAVTVQLLWAAMAVHRSQSVTKGLRFIHSQLKCSWAWHLRFLPGSQSAWNVSKGTFPKVQWRILFVFCTVPVTVFSLPLSMFQFCDPSCLCNSALNWRVLERRHGQEFAPYDQQRHWTAGLSVCEASQPVQSLLWRLLH